MHKMQSLGFLFLSIPTKHAYVCSAYPQGEEQEHYERLLVGCTLERQFLAECVGRLRAVVARLRMETPHPAHRKNHFFEGAMPVSALLFSEPPLAKSPERRRPAPGTNLSD